MTDHEIVEEQNNRLYLALSNCDIDAMSQVWAHEEWVVCVHPGWNMVVGWDRVRESWEGIFSGGMTIRVRAQDVHILIEGDMAWVRCRERILALARGQVGSTAAVATTIFKKMNGEWKLICHHASPGMPLAETEDPSSN